MAVIKKEQDKAAPAKPFITSGFINTKGSTSQISPCQKKRHQVGEGNNAGSKVARVLLLHASNKEIV
eukprot:6416219-Ditylum_brightwellii.AAC.1